MLSESSITAKEGGTTVRMGIRTTTTTMMMIVMIMVVVKIVLLYVRLDRGSIMVNNVCQPGRDRGGL